MTAMLMSNTVSLLEPAIFYESSADSKEFIHSLSSQMEPIMNFDTMNNVSHEGLAQFDNIVNGNNDQNCGTNLCDGMSHKKIFILFRLIVLINLKLNYILN